MSNYVRAIYEFNAEPGTTEISITVGEVLFVTRTDVGEGWWEGQRNNGEIGLFPAAYVHEVSPLNIPDFNNENEETNAHVRGKCEVDINNDEWEDDWDDENETYTEIEPSKQQSNRSQYDNKILPAIPSDIVTNTVTNTTGLKKSGLFCKISDSYILGLDMKETLPQTEIVNIIEVDGFFCWAASKKSYTVIVASPKKESKFKGMKTFIAYQLTPSFSNISVSRRYKHFDWLQGRLVEKFCLIPIPPLPDKQISGRYEEQFVEHRRNQLQEFVNWVCRHPVLSKCEVWYHFLTCTDEKIWKMGKRKAERDMYVGITYCLAIVPPEKQLIPSFVDSQMETFLQFIHSMDISVKNLLLIANDTGKRYHPQCKKEFQRIGDGLSEVAKALNIDERRLLTKTDISISEQLGRIGGIFISIGQMYGDQSKLDWTPFSDHLHIYRGILNTFPDIISMHKGVVQKRKEYERLATEQKIGNQLLTDVNRRIDVISYAIMSEMTHFKTEIDTHLREAHKFLIEAQIKFYTLVVEKLEEAYKQFEK